MAAGPAKGRRTLPGTGNSGRHAGNVSSGSGADIQVTCVHGNGALLFRIGHACACGIFDAVHANCNHAGQIRLLPGQLQGRRPGLKGGGCLGFHGYKGFPAAALPVNCGILQPGRICLVDIGVRPYALGADFGLRRNADAHGDSLCPGSIRTRCADRRRLAVFFNRGDIRIVDLGPDGFFAVSFFGTFIAFRQGHADAQSHRRVRNRQLGSAGGGVLAGLICSFY